jgi:hypothetical protein
LFSGGIEYPVVSKSFHCSLVAMRPSCSADIKFWFVPKDNKSFFVIKTFETSQKGTP